MLKSFLSLFAVTAFFLTAIPAYAAEDMAAPASTPPAAAAVGLPAPDFTAIDSNGMSHKLSDFKGKTIVLEWTNHECPFVRKHYDTENMQTLQKLYTGKGVIWLTINSSAEGKQGHTTSEQANAVIKKEGSAETARLLDPTGAIGKLYGATTTPHMFVINEAGMIVYAGAIDDQPSVSHATVKMAKNYVSSALDALAAGTPVAVATSKPYGCGIKY